MKPPPQLALNGRFLTQGLTGVQRFATEIAGAMDSLAAARGWPATRVLIPPGTASARFGHLETSSVGRTTGQRWEQFELPWHSRGRFLLNLGNTGPVLAGRRQAVVIHDAGVFDTPDSYSPRFRAWYRALHATLARTGATLVTVSEFSRGRISTRLGIDRARIAVMPEGGEHILRHRADADVLARHGLQAGGYALAVGTLAAHKNMDALATAAAVLAQRGLQLATVGSANATVFRPTDAPGSAGPIALGRVSDAQLRALYEGARCLVFPSRYEGFGLPPLEAMACGCPVVATRVGAVPDVCGDAALYFDGQAPATLAAALHRLLDEPGRAARMRERGRSQAGLYSWPRAAQVLLSLIEPAAARRFS